MSCSPPSSFPERRSPGRNHVCGDSGWPLARQAVQRSLLSELTATYSDQTSPQFDPPVTWKQSRRDGMTQKVSKSIHAKSESKSQLFCCDCSLCSSRRLQSPCVGCKPMRCTWPAAATMQSNAVQCSSTTFFPRNSLQIPLAPRHSLSGRKQDLTKKRLRLL